MTTTRTAVDFLALTTAVTVAACGCNSKSMVAEDISPGVIIEQAQMAARHEDRSNAIKSASPKGQEGGGLLGALGGARVRVRKAGTHEVLIPMPQLAPTQIPVSYCITTTAKEAEVEYRLRTRADSNVVVSVRLTGRRNQEIQIDWASIILIIPKPLDPDVSRPERYLQATACVQSNAPQVATLAKQLWPESGRIDVYAANIQEFIGNMKQNKRPRSMDAVGILNSGGNWICTANANLAAALLRSRDVPARSVAVIPTSGQRLEMHRVVEYFEGGQWFKFDPSRVHKDIPMKPWQNVIMAETTIADEDIAMTPRMGTSLGCPYGQELELLNGGITLWGKDFFWTMAKPLARFEASDEAIGLAGREWARFLETGKLSHNQVEAASARNADRFLEALKKK